MKLIIAEWIDYPVLRMLPFARETHTRCRECPTLALLERHGQTCKLTPLHDYCEADPRPHMPRGESA